MDFPAFISAYPFKPDSDGAGVGVSTLTDPIMECNQGSFRADDIQGWARHSSNASLKPCFGRISIQTMTTMLMGYKRPDYLARIGRIKATDDVLDMLEDAIEQQTPFISDYF